MPTADAADAYELHAQSFLNKRDRSAIGATVVARWAQSLPNGATTIELACGGGYPITRQLQAARLQLWAVDASPTLVATFKRRFSNIPVQCARVQVCDFFNRRFDAAVAIGLLFLLPEIEQAALLQRLSAQLNPAGRLLFTAPVETGGWVDLNTGHRCYSAGRDRYRAMLDDAGFEIVANPIDSGANHYYDARLKSGQ